MSQLAPRPKYPSAKFDIVGKFYSGRIVEPPEDRQARKYQTNDLAFWPDGQPVIQTRIVLEPEGGGERIAVYAQGRMAQAIRQAVAAASAPDIEVGGLLSVKFDHVEPSKGGGQPAKCYVAIYKPPANTPANTSPWGNEWPDEPPYDEPPF